MKKFLLLCLNIGFIAPIAAARPILTKEKWEQMKKERGAQYGLQDEIMPETRPMLIEEEEAEGVEEIAQTPPPLPPRPITPSQLPPRPVTPPPLPPRPSTQKSSLPPRPVVQQPTKAADAKSSLPFTDQDLANQAGKLKKPTTVTKTPVKEPLSSFKEQLESKFKGASGSEDESETEAWEWED